MALDQSIISRLVFAKRLYIHGHEHAVNGTELDRMLAIHGFDNSIELSLKCVLTFFLESVNRNEEKAFGLLWAAIDSILASKSLPPLPKKQDMMRLHDARNGSQHYGNIPSDQDIKRFDFYTEDFLKYLLENVFKLKYEELFMSSLVSNGQIKSILTDSEQLFGKNDFAGSIQMAAKAFAIAQVIAGKENTSRYSRRHASFGLIKNFRLSNRGLSSWGSGLPDDIAGGVIHIIRKVLQDVDSDIERNIQTPVNDFARDLSQEIEVLRLDLPYLEYSRFERVSPRVYFTGRGEKPEIIDKDPKNYTRDNAVFCYNFVLETVLKWQLLGVI